MLTIMTGLTSILGIPVPLLIIFGLCIVGLLILLIIVRNKSKKSNSTTPEFEDGQSDHVDMITPPNTDGTVTDPRVEELNNDLETFGFAYDQYQDIFYSLMYPWQRSMGYCRIYDEATVPMSMIIDAEPIYFNYNGKKWLIELWKGQYGMTTGAEVGIYNTDGPDLNIPGLLNGTFYQCVPDEERIHMSFILRKNGNIIFTRSDYHWWLTGFKLAEFSKPYELTMDIMLEFPNLEMTAAVVNSLERMGYNSNNCVVQGTRVYMLFDQPYTEQVYTRNDFTESLVDGHNQYLINTYEEITADYTDTLDKLFMVKHEAPELYDTITNLGKTKETFAAFQTIQGFLQDRDVERM